LAFTTKKIYDGVEVARIWSNNGFESRFEIWKKEIGEFIFYFK
jgi:hypothetical protein